MREVIDDLVRERLNWARERLVEQSEYTDVDPDDTTRADMRVLENISERLPSYAVGPHIEEAVNYAFASPWTSRLDRLHDLRDFLRYARGESVDSPSEFVQQVIDGESGDYDVQPLHDVINPELGRWERSDLQVIDLWEWGNDIKMVPTARAQALETALANSDAYYEREAVIKHAIDLYDDVTGETARNYADLVDMDVVNDGQSAVVIDVSDLTQRLKSGSIKNAPSTRAISIIERKDDWWVAGFEPQSTPLVPVPSCNYLPIRAANTPTGESDSVATR